ncbi:MAG: hypothetical protein JOZ08_06125 [Verrucomicrobia bacterium]|nr:hypothetical protein [Verrucomicrobiota bacterium]
MISGEEIEAWARLYDRGYNAFEVDNITFELRAELDRQIESAYKRVVPAGSISFRDFRREAIKQIRAFLAKERRPPTT